MWRRSLAVATALVLGAAARGAVDPGAAAPPRTDFVPPAAGSYQLQRIQPVADAVLLDASGRSQSLSSVTLGKVTLLTFFYTYCMDPLGCPFAYVTLSNMRDQVLAERNLTSAVRFVSVSLDPSTDTPAAISRYGEQFATDPRFEWRFLTARSVADLLPVLDDFGQDVSVETDNRGRPTRTLHHMLKVFLIDREGIVREIYSLAFLQPDVMFNDIRTLVMEKPRRTASDAQ
jgi:cytochrome oxidase Cu insertion factor (SCO1/SenC/PrrC family)